MVELSESDSRSKNDILFLNRSLSISWFWAILWEEVKGKGASGEGKYLWTIAAPSMQRNDSMRMRIRNMVQ